MLNPYGLYYIPREIENSKITVTNLRQFSKMLSLPSEVKKHAKRVTMYENR